MVGASKNICWGSNIVETIIKIKDCTVIIYHRNQFQSHEIERFEQMRFAELYNVGNITGFEIVEGES